MQPTGMLRKKAGFLSDDSGISFIDLMLALVVLTIGVLAMMDLQVIALRSNASSQNSATALALAETKMEAIKNTTFTSLATQAAATTTVQGVTFTTTVTVTNNTPIAGAKKVDITVTWSDKAGAHSIPLATVISQQ